MRRLLTALTALTIAAAPAHAGMIRPDDFERERVKALLERDEVRAALEQHGVLAEEAAARVEAMTPAEVQSLAGRIDALATGGQQSTQNLLLLIIIILLVIIII